ncbi:MAG: hypothetical protein FWC73_08875 [Defluviitaleaceae bacterium]|nr:hypothetical protein [Defluviitaleaceae bacterium]
MLYPAGAAWLNSRGNIRRQQEIYNSYVALVREYHEREADFEPRRLLPYDGLAVAMASVQNLAITYGLEIQRFDATQPVERDMAADGSVFVEMQISAVFSGERSDEFIYGLASSEAFVRTLRIDFSDDGDDNLRVEFSVFGRRE